MVYTRSSLAKVPTNAKAPSYSPTCTSSSHRMSSSSSCPFTSDASPSSTDTSSPESSPSPPTWSESPVPHDMASLPSPGSSLRPGLISSVEPSATSETSPSSALPTIQLGAIEIKQSHVAAAKGVEARARRDLADAQREASDHQQAAKSKRQKAKDLEVDAKKLRAKIIHLKAAAKDDENSAKGIKSLFFDLDEGVDDAVNKREKLESELADLQHEKMLRERYPDPVIRKLVERMNKNGEVAEILDNFQRGELRLEEIETLEAQLDDICQEISKVQADGLGGGSGESHQDPAGVEEEDDDEMGGDVEGGDNSIVDEDMGSMEKSEDDKGNYSPTICSVMDNSIKQGPDGGDRPDNALVSIKPESELGLQMEVETDSKDVLGKSEIGMKDEPDPEEDDWLSALTEPKLRKRLRAASVLLEGWKVQALQLTGGMRKREYEDD